MDFKTSPLMYGLALFVVAFVIVQSVFFMAKANKRAKEIGMDKAVVKQTIFSSVLFTIAPAISILATVLALASALGIVLPWIRLSVIGNLAYESTAASAVLGNLNQAITDKSDFSTVAWVMTIGSCLPLILMPILCKKLHSKIGGALSGDSKVGKLGDYISAGAFIGIITAFVATSINGKSSDGKTDGGFLSIAVLIVAVVLYLILEKIATKFNLKKFEPFVMPLAMFGAMGAAVLLTTVLPAELVAHSWFN